ncbi:hypothetical protein EYF80_065223 [Liparis tanakae]|uniref:Uncharacterized protein n=1 Tax=Liparis tanakae TaxID=230148 RepID=A0A4Z2E7V4_9TELE|nr:hypothetical protein EYF80_065223 [Liparis tanakae]
MPHKYSKHQNQMLVGDILLSFIFTACVSMSGKRLLVVLLCFWRCGGCGWTSGTLQVLLQMHLVNRKRSFCRRHVVYITERPVKAHGVTQNARPRFFCASQDK